MAVLTVSGDRARIVVGNSGDKARSRSAQGAAGAAKESVPGSTAVACLEIRNSLGHARSNCMYGLRTSGVPVRGRGTVTGWG